MSEFVEVNAAELTGPALDWVVAQIEGVSCTPHTIMRFYRPSTDWAQGGPLIDKYNIQLTPHGNLWDAQTDLKMGPSSWARQFGTTPLISLCRAIVAAKHGNLVMVPSVLVGGCR